MFWFDRNQQGVLFADKRRESHILCDGRVLNITPQIQIDFRNMPFRDNSFKLIVFDPPHLHNLGGSSWMAKKYGRLNNTWQTDITQGFNESMRCLELYGILIFKWNERDIPATKIIKIVNTAPLFGHITGKQTIWMTFMKKEKEK